MEELTIQQEDEILRADMFAEESGINDQEETTETQDDEVVETQEEETFEETIDTQEKEAPKKKNNIAKILAEKNEYKREAMEAKRKIAELEASVWNDRDTDISYIDTLVDKKIAERLETQDFFTRNPNAREYKEELDEFRNENPNISYDRAYKLYLAETNPQALLDEQTKNKLNSNIYSTAWRTSLWLRQANSKLDYSDSELDELIKAGKVKL